MNRARSWGGAAARLVLVGAVGALGACQQAPAAATGSLTVQTAALQLSSVTDATYRLVELSILGLYEGSNVPIAASEWQNPTADGPLVQTVTCRENADVLVKFDVTVMRQAKQGFFDIGVTFSNVFCSAKVDCKESFLHGESERAPTVVLGFACTSG